MKTDSPTFLLREKPSNDQNILYTHAFAPKPKTSTPKQDHPAHDVNRTLLKKKHAYGIAYANHIWCTCSLHLGRYPPIIKRGNGKSPLIDDVPQEKTRFRSRVFHGHHWLPKGSFRWVVQAATLGLFIHECEGIEGHLALYWLPLLRLLGRSAQPSSKWTKPT